MNMNRLVRLNATLASIVLLTLGGARAVLAAAGPDAYVVAVNNPLAYFAQRLAGDAIEVRLPVPEATDPAFWQPDVDDILLLQGAELVLLNGAGYSPWLNKVAISRRSLVVTIAQASWIPLQDQVTHSHGPRGDHAHGGHAVTTWLDMSLAATQARAVAPTWRPWTRVSKAVRPAWRTGSWSTRTRYTSISSAAMGCPAHPCTGSPTPCRQRSNGKRWAGCERPIACLYGRHCQTMTSRQG